MCQDRNLHARSVCLLVCEPRNKTVHRQTDRQTDTEDVSGDEFLMNTDKTVACEAGTSSTSAIISHTQTAATDAVG